MKLYESMRNGENLDWCASYANEKGEYIVINSGVVISSTNSKLVGVKSDSLDFVWEWKELGCNECPWRDECDAMLVEQ